MPVENHTSSQAARFAASALNVFAHGASDLGGNQASERLVRGLRLS